MTKTNNANNTLEKPVQKGKFRAASIARSALCVAFISVCSVITIPIGSVPITMSLFGIMLTALLLSPAETFLAIIVYIALGAIGVPVFSGGGSGLGVLTGPTGGFILSYPLMTSIISAFRIFYRKKGLKDKVKHTTLMFLVCLLTLPVCYTIGTLQFINYAGVSAYAALTVCVLPFIIPDVFKSVLAVWLAEKIRPRIGLTI